MAVADPAVEIIKDAVIPPFGGPVTFEYPENIPSAFLSTNIYSETFKTLLLLHIITYLHTQGSPLHTQGSPQRILAHCGETNPLNVETRDYREKVQSVDGTGHVCSQEIR